MHGSSRNYRYVWDVSDRNFHEFSNKFRAQKQLEEIAMVMDKSIFPLASRVNQKNSMAT